MKSWQIATLIVPMIVLTLLPGCIDTTTPAEIAAAEIDQAIAKIDQDARSWQQTLTELGNKLEGIEKNAARDVDLITQRAIATTGGEFRCNVDFLSDRVKQNLRHIADQLRGKNPSPIKPGLCQVVPSSIDMANRPNVLEYFGYDLDSAGTEVSMQDDSGTMSLKDWTKLPTHYHLTVKTSPTDGVPLCNRDNRRIVLKWGSEVLSSVDVIKAPCLPPPPPPTPRAPQVVFDIHLKDSGGTTGASYDRPYGLNCSPGFHRLSVDARNESTGNVGWCGENGWEDDNNPHSCVAIIHVGMRPFQGVDCHIIIREVGDQLPPPPPPPCPCQ